MAFRKRNIGISRIGTPSSDSAENQVVTPILGVRPSPSDGRPTVSSGAPSLDGILAGHAGLPLGSSLLIEESGTTDFAGAFLRLYAAEGIVQGHKVHVVGLGEQWGRDLPGLIGVYNGSDADNESSKKSQDRMKIAWRYERLREGGNTIAGARGTSTANDGPSSTADQSQTAGSGEAAAFCHIFDLAKRLTFPVGTTINYIQLQHNPEASPFLPILTAITKELCSAPNIIHRLIIPTTLSPAFYPMHASQPQHLLQFFHSLRSVLRQHPTKLTVMVTLPLELYPRSSGLIRWVELLNDGVIELAPFPHLMDADSELATSGAATTQEERPQGMLKIHQLPVFHEKGGGGGSSDVLANDLAFTLSRRKITIKPFSLPPLEGDTEAQQGHVDGVAGAQARGDLSF